MRSVRFALNLCLFLLASSACAQTPITSLPKDPSAKTPASAPRPASTSAPALVPEQQMQNLPSIPTPPPSTQAAPAPEAPTLRASSNQLAANKNTKARTDATRKKSIRAFSTAAIGVNVGIAGIGVQVATPLSERFNARAGGAFFSYSDTFTTDGIDIKGDLKFRSATFNLDWFPFHGGFRISPGVTLYNGNNLTATAFVAGGKNFDLDTATYQSSVADPVNGTASLTFGNRTAPNLTIGWGNMVPRSGKHWTFPFEIGAQYIDQPLINITLKGTACNGSGCFPIATDPTAQANLRNEIKDLNNDISPLRFYPIINAGVAYKF